MKITLDQKEIEQALVAFVSGQGICIADKNIAVTLIAGKELTAAIDISGGATQALVAAPVMSQEAAPVFGQIVEAASTTAAGTEDNDPDREAIKASLDKMGIVYLPKARTATLVALYEDAKAAREVMPAQPVTEAPAPAQEVENVFGNVFGAPAAEPVKEEPPFDVTSPVIKEEEELDDDRPLFGN